MEMYVITKEGVYRHEIFGVFVSDEIALEHAKTLIQKEPDHYHTFDISKVTLNVPDEDELIWSARRFPDGHIVVTDWRKHE